MMQQVGTLSSCQQLHVAVIQVAAVLSSIYIAQCAVVRISDGVCRWPNVLLAVHVCRSWDLA